jgi:hypothetical protein
VSGDAAQNQIISESCAIHGGSKLQITSKPRPQPKNALKSKEDDTSGKKR